MQNYCRVQYSEEEVENSVHRDSKFVYQISAYASLKQKLL